MDQFDIVVIGEINADLILSGNVVPVFGQVEQIVDNSHLVMGSSAVIFACGCSRLGLKTAFIGKVGDDLFGQFMLDSMHDRGIDTSGVIKETSMGTGLSVILASEGDRAILTYPGVIPELKYSDINFDVIKKGRHLHLSGYFLLEQLQGDVQKLFEGSKVLGLSISLDTNYDPTEQWNSGLDGVLETVNIFLPNETEAKAITRESDLNSAMNKLSARGEQVIVKLGEEGAAGLVHGQEPVFQNTVPASVIDTVGAGDSFDAGYVYGYLQGWSLKNALAFAVACGTLSTLEAGGTAGQATVEKAENFVNENFLGLS